MDSLLSFTKPDYFSTAFSNIEQRLQHSSSSSMESSLTDFLEDYDPGQANTLYSSWGEWLYWWDAIDFMQNRLESDDVVRKIFVVEDIIYYWHYIPYRGHKDNLFDSADMHLSYEDYEEGMFYLGPVEDEESIAYASSQAPYLPMPPDDDIEENKRSEEENDPAANDIPIAADEAHGHDAEKVQAQKENPDIILEAIRMFFVSGRRSLPQKLKLFDKTLCNAPVPDYD